MSKEKKKGDDGSAASVCKGISIFLLLAGVTLLVLWLVYRPEKPRFMVIGAAIYGFNGTSPASMQFSVIIKNPNRRVSIYYDRLSTYVSYRNDAITPQVLLPPLYQKKHSSVSVSPLIGVSLEVLNGLAVEEPYGVISLTLIFEGRIRWKLGAIKTSHYGVHVNCHLFMGFKKGFVGQLPLLGVTPCHLHL